MHSLSILPDATLHHRGYDRTVNDAYYDTPRPVGLTQKSTDMAARGRVGPPFGERCGWTAKSGSGHRALDIFTCTFWTFRPHIKFCRQSNGLLTKSADLDLLFKKLLKLFLPKRQYICTSNVILAIFWSTHSQTCAKSPPFRSPMVYFFFSL